MENKIESLTKMELKKIIRNSTTKVYNGLFAMQKHELVKLAKSILNQKPA